MELYGQNTAMIGSQNDQIVVWVPVRSVTGHEESIGRPGLWAREGYPERLGGSDCAYYIQTGLSGFGSDYRYNHPCGHHSVGLPQMRTWSYPERPGEPACQYYLRTGICKFGASCKFHHPKNDGGSLSEVQLNTFGFPLRPDEKECSYYLKTGQCKFGITCIFHHPQPTGISGQATAHPFFLTMQSRPGPSLQQYNGASTSFRVARHPLLPTFYIPSAYGHVILHPRVVPVPNWTHFGPIRPTLYSAHAFVGPHSLLHPSVGPLSLPQYEHFPERLGKPECQYYLRTGNCKFGSSCKFYHPPDRVSSNSNCAFSPLGLPLRPGVQPCCFYLQKGFCKFGGNCKFDHPVKTVQYSPSASTLNAAAAPYMLGSLAPTSLADTRATSVQASIAEPSVIDPFVGQVYRRRKYGQGSGQTDMRTTSVHASIAGASVTDPFVGRVYQRCKYGLGSKQTDMRTTSIQASIAEPSVMDPFVGRVYQRRKFRVGSGQTETG